MSVMEAQSCLEMGPSLRSQQVGQEREGRGWAREGAERMRALSVGRRACENHLSPPQPQGVPRPSRRFSLREGGSLP